MKDVRIRDFIYMDVERLKSIVAQVEEGLAEQFTHTSGSTQELGGNVEGGLLGILRGTANLGALWENQEAETRSLHDYLYNKVESALVERELLLRIPEDVEDSHVPGGDTSHWLSETAFFLARGRVSINDFARMRVVLDNMNALGTFMAQCVAQNATEALVPRERKNLERLTREQMQLDGRLVKGFQVFFDTFYRDRVVIKLAPFSGDPNFRFVGNLNPSYLRDDIDSITYKYGTSPASCWTVFGQVAAIAPEIGNTPMAATGGGEIEQSLHALFDSLREIEFLAQSVTHPEVAITPIAIYRE